MGKELAFWKKEIPSHLWFCVIPRITSMEMAVSQAHSLCVLNRSQVANDLPGPNLKVEPRIGECPARWPQDCISPFWQMMWLSCRHRDLTSIVRWTSLQSECVMCEWVAAGARFSSSKCESVVFCRKTVDQSLQVGSRFPPS